MSEDEKTSVIRETDETARTLAKHLLREARQATLASLEAGTGHPLASRVTMANDLDGTPLILVSELSGHTPAIRGDARSSLLIGESGKGDPLAHARMSVMTMAEQLDKTSEAHKRARQRFLARHPKAELYVDFGDFHFFRLTIERISLNGGFGKAYELTAPDVLSPGDLDYQAFFEMEADVVAHMNEDHQDSIQHYAAHYGKSKDNGWHMTGLDPAGLDLANHEQTMRIDFSRILQSVDEIRPMLVKMAKEAKEQG